MMDHVSAALLDELAATAASPCVSIYLPTHRYGRETLQDPIRLKNLLGQAAEQLAGLGLRTTDVTSLLAPASALLEDSLFWSHQADGLAVLLHRGGMRTFRMPEAVDESVTVGTELELAPLRRVVTLDGRYWVLALSQHEVRLVQATRYGATEVDLSGVAHSMVDANWFVRREPTMSPPGGGRRGGGDASPAFGGSAGIDQDLLEDRARFLRGVDTGVRSVIGLDDAPIVLAAESSVAADFRKHTKLRHLVPEVLEGSPDRLSVEQLHQRSLPLAEGHLVH